MYWLIYYKCKDVGGPYIPGNDLHKGSIAEWLLEVIKYREEYVFCNAKKLTEKEFLLLDGKIG